MARGDLALVGDSDGWMQPLKRSDLDTESGTEFGYMDRLFYAFDDGAILDYGNWEAVDLHTMLETDYKARQVMNALTLPSLSTRKHIEPAKGDSGEAEFISNVFAVDPEGDADALNGVACQTPLDTVVAQMMTAFAYKRSFHEIVWTRGRGDLDGKHIMSKIAFRPQTTCRMMRSPVNGEIIGFEQDPYLTGTSWNNRKYNKIRLKRNRSLIHIHGAWQDPVNGVSLMEVPYWAYKTKQKLLFLWFQYLEGVALPRSVVLSDDEDVSRRIAGALRKTKNSGVVAAWSNNPESTKIDTLDLAGAQGASEFMKALTFLDQCSTQEILAGFLDLTNTEKSGGSYALSRDGSDFYLQSAEARDRELEQTVRSQIFAPLIRYNLGPSARIPHYRMAPLTAEDNEAATSMLQSLLASRDPSTSVIPHEFIGELATKVAASFGMDEQKIRDSFIEAAKQSAQLAAQQSKQMASVPGQQVAATQGAVAQALTTARQATTTGVGKI